jgi:hypothetical protein
MSSGRLPAIWEREREKRKFGGGSLKQNFCCFEGSQAVPASPSGRGEACMRDFFNFNFKKIGAAAMERNLVWYWESYIGPKFWNVTIWRAACEATHHLLWDQEKPWSNWPVAWPSGYKLTSGQQSGIEYASPNIIPYLWGCFIIKYVYSLFCRSFYVQ